MNDESDIHICGLELHFRSHNVSFGEFGGVVRLGDGGIRSPVHGPNFP